MTLPRSTTGIAFAAVYLLVYAAAYLDYRRQQGTWMADIWLAILAVPYTLAGRLLTGNTSFQFEAREWFDLLVAGLMCAGLAYALGAAIGAAIRWLARALKRGTQAR
jgi:hypothetical protein